MDVPSASRLPRRLVADDDFETAVDALGSPEAKRIAHALVRSIGDDPERHTTAFSDLTVRVLRSRALGEYPALRIFYSFDASAVYLLHVELYDELAP